MSIKIRAEGQSAILQGQVQGRMCVFVSIGAKQARDTMQSAAFPCPKMVTVLEWLAIEDTSVGPNAPLVGPLVPGICARIQGINKGTPLEQPKGQDHVCGIA